MELYRSAPALVLYDKDLVGSEAIANLKEISQFAARSELNPADVVLESLINVLAENISGKQVTTSQSTVLLNRSAITRAAEELQKILEEDIDVLRSLHHEWLRMLGRFLTGIDIQRVSTTDEAIFQVSKEFRISASSAVKAVSSLVDYSKKPQV
jgi:hypothetical protein